MSIINVFTITGSLRNFKLDSIESRKLFDTNTCNQDPWATNGFSSLTRDPDTDEATKVIVASPVNALKVKWRPCLIRPLKVKFVINIFNKF